MLGIKETREIMNRGEIIICDWDNVIQNIDIPWIANLIVNKDKFEGLFKEELLDVKQENYLCKVLGRQDYYLNDWLLKDGVEFTKDNLKDFMSLYIDDPNFYNKCKFTQLANTLPILVEQKFCKEIIFLSHVPKEMGNYDERKQKIFEEYKKSFSSTSVNKIDLVMLSSDQSKSEWVKENKPDYTTAIDDRFDIIKDYIYNTKSAKKLYILPRLGYNAPLDNHLEDDKEKIKIFAYNILINYISPF